MAGFFKKLFGSSNEAPKRRRLSHPRDLRAGDIIKFRHLDQPDVSGKEFEVSQINTYIYGNLCYPELILKDRTNHIIYMMVEEEDGEEYLALSRKIAKADLNDVIPADEIAKIRSPGTGTTIVPAIQPEGFEPWFVERYKEVDDRVKGTFVKGDVRYLSDEDANSQEQFSSHILEDSEGEYALELEIYDTGEMELSVSVYHDINEIEQMWPSNMSENS